MWLLANGSGVRLAHAGVVFYQFRVIRLRAEEHDRVNPHQSQWMTIARYLMRLRYERQIPAPAAPWRRACYAVASSERTDAAIMLVIVLNVAEMTVWWYDMSGVVVQVKETANLVFSAVFLVRHERPCFAARVGARCDRTTSPCASALRGGPPVLHCRTSLWHGRSLNRSVD